MVNTVLNSLGMLIGGFLASALWVFVIGLAGAPGAMLMAVARERSIHDGARVAALLVVVAGQLVATLTWAAFVMGSAHAIASNRGMLQRVVLLACGVVVSNFPGGMAARDAKPDANFLPDITNPQHGAIFMTVPATVLASIVFAVFPTAIRFGWGWVPYPFG